MQLLVERGADTQYAVPHLDARLNIECESCSRQFTAEFNSLHSYQVLQGEVSLVFTCFVVYDDMKYYSLLLPLSILSHSFEHTCPMDPNWS